jgi:hypothetical protein
MLPCLIPLPPPLILMPNTSNDCWALRFMLITVSVCKLWHHMYFIEMNGYIWRQPVAAVCFLWLNYVIIKLLFTRCSYCKHWKNRILKMNKINYVGMLGISFNTGTPWFMQDSTYANLISHKLFHKAHKFSRCKWNVIVNICFLCLTIIFLCFHCFI